MNPLLEKIALLGVIINSMLFIVNYDTSFVVIPMIGMLLSCLGYLFFTKLEIEDKS